MARKKTLHLTLSEAEREAIIGIAGELGYFASRGSETGKPSVSALLAAVANGDLAIVPVADDIGTGLNIAQRIILEIRRDPNRTAEEIAEAVGCATNTVHQVRSGWMGKQSAQALRERGGD